MRKLCVAAARSLVAMPAETPSLRLVADEAARVLAGLSRVLDGLALLIAEHSPGRVHRRRLRFYVPDWLPALANGGRAFVAIGAVAVFWIVSEWPNGAMAITWTAIGVLLFAPRADEAYARTVGFMVGNVFAAAVRGHRGIRAAAAGGNVRRLQHGDGPVSDPSGRADGPALADRDVYRSGSQLRAAARADQSDDLQYAAILQYRALDCRRWRGCGAVVSAAAAAVAIISDTAGCSLLPCAICATSRSVPSGSGKIGKAACTAGSRCCPTRPSRCNARNSWRRCRSGPRSSTCAGSLPRLGLGAELCSALADFARPDIAAASDRICRARSTSGLASRLRLAEGAFAASARPTAFHRRRPHSASRLF